MIYTESKREKSNRDTTLMLVPFMAFLAKIIQILLLPDKYKYDGYRMQSMMNGDKSMGSWGAYEDVVDIYKKINIFKFTTVEQWSIFFGLIFTIVVMILLSRVKYMSVMECVYTLMAVGILNIYVFTLGKEPIQMFYFICISIIILLPIKNNVIKILGCAGVYYWESNTFREYYIMMAVMTLVLYLLFYFLKKIKNIRPIHIIIAIVLCYTLMFSFVYASQYVKPDQYKEVMKVRDEYANEEANTTIDNIWPVENNFGRFIGNYIICSVRMMMPIELVWKGIGYFPFFVYQVFLLIFWIRALKNLKKLDDRVLLALTCFTAYLFGSFVFEPDFGSWLRHEASTFPIFFLMAYEEFGIEKTEEELYETKTV